LDKGIANPFEASFLEMGEKRSAVLAVGILLKTPAQNKDTLSSATADAGSSKLQISRVSSWPKRNTVTIASWPKPAPCLYLTPGPRHTSFVQKLCAKCGSAFDCHLEDNCWCAELPHIPLPQNLDSAGCLCRACLLAKIKAAEASRPDGESSSDRSVLKP
jgi:hypothetical protein